MKKITLALISCALIACQADKKNTAEISGKIHNPIGATASVLGSDKSQVYTDSLNENNQFSIQFELNEPQYMSFKHGKETTAMYVVPGDKIQLSIDPNEYDESISYTGSNASNFLAKKYLIEENSINRALYALPTDSFLTQLQTVKKELIDALKLTNNDKFNKEQTEKIWMEFAITKLNYPNYFEYLNTQTAELGDHYYDFVSEINLNNDALLQDDQSVAFLKAYVKAKTTSITENLDFIAQTFSNQSIKNKLAYDMLKEILTYEGVEQIEGVIEKYKDIQTDTVKYNELADLAYEMIKYKPGQPAIDFSYPDAEGNLISLSDFKGSYVYVDVWATWCGPCKREIPHLIKLEEDYHDKNITFIGVSVDEDKDREAWLNMIKEKGMKGTQLFASGWSEITKDYMINGIPRFMLFDPEGNIVNIRATRPSQQETRILFDLIL